MNSTLSRRSQRNWPTQEKPGKELPPASSRPQVNLFSLFQFRRINSNRISKLTVDEHCLLPPHNIRTLHAHQSRQIKLKRTVNTTIPCLACPCSREGWEINRRSVNSQDTRRRHHHSWKVQEKQDEELLPACDVPQRTPHLAAPRITTLCNPDLHCASLYSACSQKPATV